MDMTPTLTNEEYLQLSGLTGAEVASKLWDWYVAHNNNMATAKTTDPAYYESSRRYFIDTNTAAYESDTWIRLLNNLTTATEA
mgnify:FL=1